MNVLWFKTMNDFDGAMIRVVLNGKPKDEIQSCLLIHLRHDLRKTIVQRLEISAKTDEEERIICLTFISCE